MSEARTRVGLPVRRVTCLEDRAQVERAGNFEIAAGASQVWVEAVSPLAVDRSLSVEVEGARVIDARLVRWWRERPRGGLREDASQLARRVHALGLELGGVRDAMLRAGARSECLVQARADLLRSLAEQAGCGQAAPDAWREQATALAASEAEQAQRVRALVANEIQVAAQLEEANAALKATETPERELVCALRLALESAGGAVAARARYLVPCAVWRPAYRVTLRADRVLVECEAVVWQRTGEAWEDVALEFSTERPTLGTRPPRLTEDHLRTRPKQEHEKRTVDVAWREEAIAAIGEGGVSRSSELPGLDDGGLAQHLQVKDPASVPSDGQPYRVPLSSFEAPAVTERLAVPELSPLASLVARFANLGRQVLLAGPVDLVRQSGFVGRGQLRFAAVGDPITLSFGTDDDLRIVRSVAETAEEGRLSGRRTTTRQIALHVSNTSPAPARLVVEERVPVSEVREVEVQVLTKQCAPAPKSVSSQGIARLEVELPAHARQVVAFAWELTAAAKVAGV